MISHMIRKWIAVIYLLVVAPVDLQVAMYPMYPPSIHVAVPMPVPVPILIREEETTTKTTTTTTERTHFAMPFPVPVPMPMPMPMPPPLAFPAFPATSCQQSNRPKNCPPCPPCLCLPSCTPSFFSYCSPCHQKCRCRSQEDTPIPKPPRQDHFMVPPPMGPAYGVAVPVPPMIAPSPILIPFPPLLSQPQRRRPPYCSSSRESTDTDYTDDISSSSYERRRKHKKKLGHIKRRPIYRRQFDSNEISDNELVKPVLTYISQDGDVKLKRRLSKNEAAELMNDKPYQKIRVIAGADDENVPRVLITSKNERKPAKVAHRRRQVVMTSGIAQHMLGEGKKELVFRPPGGKKISNLSVSFQISE